MIRHVYGSKMGRGWGFAAAGCYWVGKMRGGSGSCRTWRMRVTLYAAFEELRYDENVLTILLAPDQTSGFTQAQ